MPLFKKHACREYNHISPLMEENCGHREDNIPQLEDVSRSLKHSSGFTLRPLAGLLSSPIVSSTQPNTSGTMQIPNTRPSRTYAMNCWAMRRSLPVRMATCHWFTIEFGLCKQDGETKAYGAGLLSSYGELQHSMSAKAQGVAIRSSGHWIHPIADR